MARTWTQQRIWQELNPYQRAAAMALMEADGRDPVAARNVLGAIINRSERTGDPLGDHVSKPIYQPTIEMSQFARLPSILKSPQFQEMTQLAERRAKGQEADWVQGATHFLAPERTMLALHAREPDKYHNWGPLPNSRGVPGRNWTGFDPAKGEYRGVILRDNSHAFLAPEGVHQAQQPDPFAGKPVQMAAPLPPQHGIEADIPSRPPSPVTNGPALGTQPTPAKPQGPLDLDAIAAQWKGNPQDQATTLDGLAGAWQVQLEEKAKAEAESKRHANTAAGLADPMQMGASPMIKGPRLPRIDMPSILAVLKERGVDPDNSGGLGTGGGILGTRRA